MLMGFRSVFARAHSIIEVAENTTLYGWDRHTGSVTIFRTHTDSDSDPMSFNNETRRVCLVTFRYMFFTQMGFQYQHLLRYTHRLIANLYMTDRLSACLSPCFGCCPTYLLVMEQSCCEK